MSIPEICFNVESKYAEVFIEITKFTVELRGIVHTDSDGETQNNLINKCSVLLGGGGALSCLIHGHCKCMIPLHKHTYGWIFVLCFY